MHVADFLPRSSTLATAACEPCVLSDSAMCQMTHRRTYSRRTLGLAARSFGRGENIPDHPVGVIDPYFRQIGGGKTGRLAADATGLANVRRQAQREEVIRLLVQQQVVVARMRPRDVAAGCSPGLHAVTRSGTGFTLSRAVYHGIRMKNRKYTMVQRRATPVATALGSRKKGWEPGCPQAGVAGYQEPRQKAREPALVQPPAVADRLHRAAVEPGQEKKNEHRDSHGEDAGELRVEERRHGAQDRVIRREV